MSRISKKARSMSQQVKEDKLLKKDQVVANFMGGDSYKFNPLDTLKMIAASSIFGEPQYYRTNSEIHDGKFYPVANEYSDDFYDSIFRRFNGKTTTEVFTEAIDNALDYDFKGTLELACNLRTDYFMRLNPQIIMVHAAIHPGRKKFTDENPGMFKKYQMIVMKRADEPMSQLAYYLYINGGDKKNIPSILKRSIASKLSTLTAYNVNKYKNADIGMINAVRITHANSPVLNVLMNTGSVSVKEDEVTWEQKRSAGMSWIDIVRTTNMGHMAMLRNIRNIFTEIEDIPENREFCIQFMNKIHSGVIGGMQFPFRYWSAYNAVKSSDVKFKEIILDALEECIDISCNNMPKLKGKTMCLTDNSGSAWRTFNSEYGTVTVANIDNLSAVIAAACSEEGYVGKFGDKLIEFPISKRNGILSQTDKINEHKGFDVGRSTEGGIWIFFKNAIRNNIHYDNIFIFSDQQAGTGGLYGTDDQAAEYSFEYGSQGLYVEMINVYKLILDYRRLVNKHVNVFSVQTAGYDNVLIPHMSYRTAMLTGWTGKEIQFASEYIKQWNDIESRNQ